MAQIFIDNHNRIMSYGNPAGYIKDDKAIADPMFKTDELTAFLTRHNFQTSWQDGVFDRLLQGQQMGASPDAPVLKNLRIWQLNNATPIEMRFISYDSLTKNFGEPDPGNYLCVYDGQVETNDLEGIYEKFNCGNYPQGFRGHSMSMSDVVELYDESGSEFHYCDRMGFEKVEFKQAQAQEQGIVSQTM